ncbi:MAG: tripartite tricarboxylate transporter TctB family protein [Cyclobacteriaceae bacterium]
MKGFNQYPGKDLITTAILLILAAWIWYYSGRFPDLPEGYPGPKLFPRIIALGLALIGLGIGVRSFMLGAKPDGDPQGSNKTKSPVRLALGVLLMGLFPVISPLLGFVNSLLLVGSLLGFVLQVKWWKALLTAGITTAGIYLIFAELLKVPL